MGSSSGGEFRGKSVEEAIEAGLASLGLKETQVNIEVLSKGSRGLLGFGAEDARVLITPKEAPVSPAKPTPTVGVPPAQESRPAPPRERPPSPKPAQPEVRKRPEATAPPVTEEAEEPGVEAVAVEVLQGMLDRMGVKGQAEVVPHTGVLDAGQEPPIVLNIEGEDLGVLIGRRGETLAAIQYLTRLMVNHRLRRWTNLVVDVEGYKARREDQLRNLAERMAERVVSSGRAVALEAMPARERRIVHITLRNHPQVTTHSVGEGEQRKVTIIPRE